MPYFDSCEGCGRDDVVIAGGLCFECNQGADRSAFGAKPLPRRDATWNHDGPRIVLAQTSRPLPEVEETE